VHALRNIHAALVPGAVLVDTQPVSPRPWVTAAGSRLGTLDLQEWAETIGAVDDRMGEAIATGLYEVGHEERFIVSDTFESGSESLETARGWRGTRVPQVLAKQLAAVVGTVAVEQEVRLRLLRRC
jgi:hypothetical protein